MGEWTFVENASYIKMALGAELYITQVLGLWFASSGKFPHDTFTSQIVCPCQVLASHIWWSRVPESLHPPRGRGGGLCDMQQKVKSPKIRKGGEYMLVKLLMMVYELNRIFEASHDLQSQSQRLT
jgi:hypothetical protein